MESKTVFFLIKDVGEYFPGITPYRVRQWCKQKRVRYNLAGNRYILRQDWLEEDLERMALCNIQTAQTLNNQNGALRKIIG